MPLHLICGFLGSGKTTLLRRLLDQQPPEERLAIMVNEFGELGIDGQILDGFDSQVLEVTGGCICCTLKTNFIAGLNWLLDEFKPDRIIVEASGLAEAGSLAQMAQGVESLKRLALISVVTVVDADFFTCREGMGSLYFDQIKTAGLILLNKTDLVPAGEVEDLARAVAEINPTARIPPHTSHP